MDELRAGGSWLAEMGANRSTHILSSRRKRTSSRNRFSMQ